MEVSKQNLLFNYFLATLGAEVRAAKEEGRYSEGVSDLPVSDIHTPPPPQVCLTISIRSPKQNAAFVGAD